jgi:hypothetical protein
MESMLQRVQGGEGAANANGAHTESAVGLIALTSSQQPSPRPPNPPLSQQEVSHMPPRVSAQSSEASLNIDESVKSNAGNDNSPGTTSSHDLATENSRPFPARKESLLNSILSDSGIQSQSDRNAAIFIRCTVCLHDISRDVQNKLYSWGWLTSSLPFCTGWRRVYR